VCCNCHRYELSSFVNERVLIFIRDKVDSNASTLKKKTLCCGLQFRYIDVSSINNDHFQSYFNSINPSELEIIDSTESSTSAASLLTCLTGIRF
jgi:hypothetical protein